MIRRRALLVGAVASLALPAAARVLRGSGIAAGPQAAAIPITGDGQITGPGTYSLQNDVSRLTLDVSNVTVLGNNHVVGFLTVGGNTNYDKSGILARDMSVGSMACYGNLSATPTALAAHLVNITVTDNNVFPALAYGSNMMFEGSTFVGGDQVDDPFVLWNARGLRNVSSYVTFEGCHFGPNFDLGLEGIGSWDNVRVSNCVSGGDGVGGWYGPNYSSDTSFSFLLTNSTFVNNTLHEFIFTDGVGNRVFATSDAAASAAWPSSTFSGNTYT